MCTQMPASFQFVQKREFEKSEEGSNPPKLMSIPARRPKRHDRKEFVPDLLSMPITHSKQYDRRNNTNVSRRNLRQEKTFGKTQMKRYTDLKRHLNQYGRRDRASVSRLNLQQERTFGKAQTRRYTNLKMHLKQYGQRDRVNLQEKTHASRLNLQQAKTFDKVKTKRYTRKEKILSLMSMTITPDLSSLKLDPDSGAKHGNRHQTASGIVDTVSNGYVAWPNEVLSDISGSHDQRDGNVMISGGKSTRTKYGVSSK